MQRTRRCASASTCWGAILLLASACRSVTTLPPQPPPDPARSDSRGEAPRLEPRAVREDGRTVRSWTVLVHPGGATERHGVERAWHEDGRPASEREYAHGAPSGRWQSWWPDGSWRADYLHLGGVPTTMRFFHDSGRPAAEGLARDGVREGEWRFWFEDGSPSQEGAYLGGQRTGVWTIHHPGGALRSRGLYADDRRVGEWKHWPATPPVFESDWSPPGATRAADQ